MKNKITALLLIVALIMLAACSKSPQSPSPAPDNSSNAAMTENQESSEGAVNDAPKDEEKEMIQGTNDFGTVGYGGPTPPDKPHNYVITVYALDTTLDLKDGFTKKAFDAAIEGHILAEASISGVYSNKK